MRCTPSAASTTRQKRPHRRPCTSCMRHPRRNSTRVRRRPTGPDAGSADPPPSLAPWHDLVAAGFGLLIDHLRREPGTKHAHAAGLLEPPDDVGRELAWTVAALPVLEDAEHQRRELQ